MPESPTNAEMEPLGSRRVAIVLILGSLMVVGGVIYLARVQVGERLRSQIAMRDARILHALWQGQVENNPWDDALPMTAEPADLLPLLLEASRLNPVRNVVSATRLFDRNGQFITADPVDVPAAELDPADFQRLHQLQPVARFRKSVPASELSWFNEDAQRDGGPLLEVLVPIQAGEPPELLGVAQFLLDGRSMAAEFAALDRTLNLQALAALAAAGGIQTLLLIAAFRALGRSHRRLAERSHRLAQTNQELALAAKTAALGAVSAHLIHGLKNPLAGLQNFVSSLEAPGDRRMSDDLESVLGATRRMQQLVNDTVRVLREQGETAAYELTVTEITDLVQTRTRGAAETTGIRLVAENRVNPSFSNRDANLILLILENLLTNAIQATPRGGLVRLEVAGNAGAVLWKVSDEGGGVPESILPHLFQPCRSTKESGSGLGLAISLQLARALNGNLELESHGPRGSRFVLSVPLPAEIAALESAGRAC